MSEAGGCTCSSRWPALIFRHVDRANHARGHRSAFGGACFLGAALWESIEYGLADVEEKGVIAEAVRRDDELTAGFVVGREHGEVMRAARQRLGCA